MGDATDALILVNADNRYLSILHTKIIYIIIIFRESTGCVKYGDTVCIKSPASKDRLLLASSWPHCS